MKFSAFEKQIQQMLYNKEEALDTNALLDKIFQNDKKRRKIFPFWWVVTGIAGGILMFYGSSEFLHEAKSIPVHKGEQVVIDTKDVASNALNHPSKTTSFPSISEYENSTNSPRQDSKVVFGKKIKKDIRLVQENVMIDSKNLNEDVENILNSQRNHTVLENAQIIPRGKFVVESYHKPIFPKRKSIECPSFSLKKKTSLFVSPEFGLSYPIKTLQERVADNSEVTDFRREQEKTLEGLHGALYLGMYVGKTPLYIKTGLAYSRLSEKLDLVYNYTRKDTMYGIVSITKSQNGDTITVIYGDIVTESVVKGQKIKHHYFHLLDIPICAGYQFSLADRWNLGVEAGILINIGLKTEGQVLASLQDFKPVEKSNYQKTLGLGYRGGLDVEFALQKNIGIGIQSRVTMYTKSFTSPHSNFKQNYWVPGLHLYAKYYFTN
ncbi:MAG: hypothetical protein WAT79_02370 [Saprospiraceae bacterium]